MENYALNPNYSLDRLQHKPEVDPGLNGWADLSAKSIAYAKDAYDNIRKNAEAIAEQKRRTDEELSSRTISKYKTFYYSGGQAQVYLEDVFLDELCGLSFSTMTNKAPIYGYSSVYFDTVARGNIIISGSLEVNFVHSHYLPIIARDIVDKRDTSSKTFLNRNSPFYPLAGTSTLDGAKEARQFQLQQALNRLKGLGNQQALEVYRDLQEQREGTVAPTGASFEEFYNVPSFNIWATFGDISDPRANSTVRKIIDVHLTGQTQTVYSNGEPIKEQYSFIARDIV